MNQAQPGKSESMSTAIMTPPRIWSIIARHPNASNVRLAVCPVLPVAVISATLPMAILAMGHAHCPPQMEEVQQPKKGSVFLEGKSLALLLEELLVWPFWVF